MQLDDVAVRELPLARHALALELAAAPDAREEQLLV
jgi:hypothetical protein